MKIKCAKLKEGAILPKVATKGAACFDLHACLDQATELDSSVGAVTIGTGLAFEIPENHAMLVFSRSGHGFSKAIRLANCTGIIDSDYRGEVKVRLKADAADSHLHIEDGDRIAQAFVIPIPFVEFELVDALQETERGAGGLGSTGVSK